MNVLILYQDDRKDADAVAKRLSEAGHAAKCEKAAAVLKETARVVEPAEVVMVFAETYKEKETYSVCERLREVYMLRNTPLLVAVNMYQMPLANRVKEMPNAHFIFTPIDTGDLGRRLSMLTGKTDEKEDQKR